MSKKESLYKIFKVLKRAYINLMFWGWNLLFLFLTIFLLIPYVLFPLIQSTFIGETDPIFLIFTVLTILVVFGAIAVGVIIKLQENHVERKKKAISYIFAFFYGVEAPVILLMLYRIFLVRLLTPAMSFLLAGVFISIVLYALHLLNSFKQKKIKTNIYSLSLHVVPLLTAIYISLFMLFYAAPPVYWLFEILGEITFDEFLFIVNPIHIIQITIVGLIIVCSIAAFATFPFIYLYLHINAWIKNFKIYKKQLGVKKVIITTILSSVLIIITMVILNIQNQSSYLELEKLTKGEATKEEISRFIDDEKKIKNNLTKIYLASYRYLSSTGTCSHIEDMYLEITGNNKFAEGVQNCYNFIAAPFLYKGDSFVQDKDKALSIYEYLFDEPIQKVQKKEIKKALSSTWNRAEVKAGLLDIDEKIVLLKEQKLDINESGNFASIELYEKYENTTFEQQEIFYYFSLPTHAVVTGLWLGESNDKSEAFKYVVSPRGAAQEVYNRQVRVRRDPALIEKVGPTQYRLRAFPIPANDRNIKNKKGEFHLWLTYATMKSEDGTWPLPVLREKRNIFWNKKTDRDFPVEYFEYTDKENWLPISKRFKNFKPEEYVKLSDSLCVSFISGNKREYDVENDGKKIALIIDRSRSMDSFKDVLENELTILKNEMGVSNLDIYLGGYSFEMVDNVRSFNPETLYYFGTTTISSELNKFEKLNIQDAYHEVIVLTDDGGYELSNDEEVDVNINIPVNLIHLENDLPPAYPDKLLETIRKSGGVVAGSVEEFFNRKINRQSLNLNNSLLSVDNGNVIEKYSGTLKSYNKSEAAKAIAASYIIENRVLKKDMNKLENLDNIHNLAKKYSLVTQYSSMIVLVNDRQRDELRRAEAQKDRFKREVEVGKEELSVPLGADVSGVPEPHEWMLLIIVLLFTGYSYYSRNNIRKTFI